MRPILTFPTNPKMDWLVFWWGGKKAVPLHLQRGRHTKRAGSLSSVALHEVDTAGSGHPSRVSWPQSEQTT